MEPKHVLQVAKEKKPLKFAQPKYYMNGHAYDSPEEAVMVVEYDDPTFHVVPAPYFQSRRQGSS
jgi:hypothetical protein